MLNFFNSILKAQNFSEEDIQKAAAYFVSEQDENDEGVVDVKFSLSDLVYLGERLPNMNKSLMHNFLVYLIKRNRFDVIIAFLSKVFVAHIDKFSYTSKNIVRMSNLERTFDRFIECTMWTEINFSLWQDAFFSSLVSSSGPLQNWKRPARDYLLDWVKKDEKGFYDFAFQNFAKYGVTIFEVLFAENVASATPKLLDYYLHNEFDEKRQVRNILKQHYAEVNNYVVEQKKNEQISIEDYVNTLLIFAHIKEALKTLSELYNKEKDATLKRTIIENANIEIPEKVVALVQAKKNSQKYSNEFSFFGCGQNDFKTLVLQNGEQASLQFVHYFLSSYNELCSYLSYAENSFFKAFFSKQSLDEFCQDVAEKLCSKEIEQNEWAYALIAQNTSIDQAGKIINFFASHKNTKATKLFVKLFIKIQKNVALELFGKLNRKERADKIVLDALLQGMIESDCYDIDTVELLRDKMIADFEIVDGKVDVDGVILSIEPDFTVSVGGNTNPPKNVLLEKKKLERELDRQIKRLKSFYHSGRLYSKENWDKLMKNKLMAYLASKLLWARYCDGSLVSVFKIDNNKIVNLTSVGKNEGEYKIGLFHPVEYSELDWHSMFNSKKSPFSQLDVGIFPPNNYNVHASVVSRFNGFMVNSKTFFARMLELDWKFGVLSVDKMASSMTKLNKELKILAEIDFTPTQIDAENTISLGELRFYKLADVLKTGNNYITNKTKSMEIGVLKPRYFSDIIYEITMAGKK